MFLNSPSIHARNKRLVLTLGKLDQQARYRENIVLSVEKYRPESNFFPKLLLEGKRFRKKKEQKPFIFLIIAIRKSRK